MGNLTFQVLATLLPLAVAPYRFVKHIRYAKAFYAAAFWAMLVLFVTSAGNDTPVPVTAAIFAFVFGKALLGLITCDIKDVDDDRRNGVITFPSGRGVKETLFLLHLMNVGLALLTFSLVYWKIFPRFMLIAEAHAVVVAIILIVMRRAEGARIFYTSEFGMDGAYALLFAFAFAGSQIH
jgi:4-hydroxybenzoate polyprenyltransferase